MIILHAAECLDIKSKFKGKSMLVVVMVAVLNFVSAITSITSFSVLTKNKHFVLPIKSTFRCLSLAILQVS